MVQTTSSRVEKVYLVGHEHHELAGALPIPAHEDGAAARDDQDLSQALSTHFPSW
jgi:hypothetical protein